MNQDRIVYLNGEYMPAADAKISIFDRSALFGDAIYEVAGVMDGKLISFESHIDRLKRSLGELQMPIPLSTDEILVAFRSLVERNSIQEGFVYMQVTRGIAERDFTFKTDMKPTVFMFTNEKSDSQLKQAKTGVIVKSVPDIRWVRRDIKTVNLLGQVLAKQAAHDAGAYEALMIDADGYITECGSTSFYIIKNNTIITRHLTNDILPGVTRKSLLRLCEKNGIELEQRLFTLDEVFEADEAFITGASTYVLGVVKVDDHVIGHGRPGETTNAMREMYLSYAKESLI